MLYIYLILALLLLVCGYIAWKLTTQNGSSDKDEAENKILREMLENLRKEISDGREKDRSHIQERLDFVSQIVNQNMNSSSKTMQTQFQQSSELIKQVTEKLTKLDETNRQVVNFSGQLEDLQRILKQPKGKGVFGEYWLETMLGHVLQPGQYQKQYKFKNQEIVDAVVFFQNKIIPIDAKFSSEKYSQIDKEPDLEKRTKLEEEFKKDLKDRIDETAKYIRPEEDTTDYAFMFIPAEGIYYDLLVQKVGVIEINRINLIEYAQKKRVLIVSPNTFFAFLQTVIEGMRAVKLQESVSDVLKRVEELGKHLNSYDNFMRSMGKNLTTTVNMYNSSYKEFKKIDKDVLKLTEGKIGGKVDVLEVEKPSAHIEDNFEKELPIGDVV